MDGQLRTKTESKGQEAAVGHGENINGQAAAPDEEAAGQANKEEQLSNLRCLLGNLKKSIQAEKEAKQETEQTTAQKIIDLNSIMAKGIEQMVKKKNEEILEIMN